MLQSWRRQLVYDRDHRRERVVAAEIRDERPKDRFVVADEFASALRGVELTSPAA